MNTTFLYKVFLVSIIHRDDDLFSRQALNSYADMWLGFLIVFNHVLDIVNVLYIKGGEYFLDFKNIFSVAIYLRDLYI